MSHDAPYCKHCGAVSDLLPLPDGRPSRVCRPCRRRQVNANRGLVTVKVRMAQPRQKRSLHIEQHRTETDTQSAIRRAQDASRRLGIPLSQALAAEGI